MTDHDRFSAWIGWPQSAAEMLRGWAMHPLVIAGQVAGVAAMQGTEIHFALAPEWRGRAITRRTTRAFLAPLLAIRGYLTTRAFDPTESQRAFLRRIGFVLTWIDGLIEHFAMWRLPFSRGT